MKMKTQIKIASLFLFLSLCSIKLFAYDQNNIMQAIEIVSSEENISKDILFTIVKIESDFSPLVISFLTNEENAKYFKTLENENIKIVIGKYSLDNSKQVVTIYPNTLRRAIKISKSLLENNFNIDVGLAQINSSNFSINEIDEIFEPLNNLRRSSKILRNCYNAKNKKMQETIECYNYGMRQRESYPYYTRFYNFYTSEFKNSTQN